MRFLLHYKKPIFIALAVIVALAAGGGLFFARSYVRAQARPWMTIFVHGSFGSLVGFLNISDVLGDKISGTLYSTVAKKMRNDTFFYKDQIILQRGLVHIAPTFDIHDVGGKKIAAYPLAKAYEFISMLVTREPKQSLFYTFGWSGLISQNSRRFEAIRFYNALGEELERLARQGIFPRIRIIAHSHGGNISLNLAALTTLLERANWDEHAVLSSDPDENDSLQQMCKLIKSLENKEHAKKKTGQKAFDYTPLTRKLVIDELVMFGCPIQPETEPFIYSGAFKRVYNFYSEEDFIQRVDWMSSKKTWSNQRISRFASAEKSPEKKKNVRVVQAKIMAEKSVQTNLDHAHNAQHEQHKDEKKEQTVFHDLLGGRNIFVRATKDPTHKELWLIDWGNEKNPHASFLAPLPVVILTPLIIKAIVRSKLNDVDITMSATQKDVNVFVSPHDKKIIKSSAKMPRSALVDLQEKIKPWKPKKVSSVTVFDALYKHITS